MTTRKTNKGKRFPTSRVNATQSGAYACDVHSTRFYVAKITATLEHLERTAVSKSANTTGQAIAAASVALGHPGRRQPRSRCRDNAFVSEHLHTVVE